MFSSVRLARAGGAQNGDDLADRNVEAHIAQDVELGAVLPAEPLGNVDERNGRVRAIHHGLI